MERTNVVGTHFKGLTTHDDTINRIEGTLFRDCRFEDAVLGNEDERLVISGSAAYNCQWNNTQIVSVLCTNSILPPLFNPYLIWGYYEEPNQEPQLITRRPSAERTTGRLFYKGDANEIQFKSVVQYCIFYHFSFKNLAQIPNGTEFNRCIFIDVEIDHPEDMPRSNIKFSQCCFLHSRFNSTRFDMDGGVLFKSCRIIQCKFTQAKLMEIKISDSLIDNTHFILSTLENVQFERNTIQYSQFDGCVFKGLIEFTENSLTNSAILDSNDIRSGDLIEFEQNTFDEFYYQLTDNEVVSFNRNNGGIITTVRIDEFRNPGLRVLEEEYEFESDFEDEEDVRPSTLRTVAPRTTQGIAPQGRQPPAKKRADSCYDVINLTEQKVAQFIEENPNALVIFYEMKGRKDGMFNAECFDGDDLLNFINSETNILYECDDDVPPFDYAYREGLQKYLLIPTGNITINVNYDEFVAAYERGQNMIFLVFDRTIPKTMGHQSSRSQNFISGNHCQKGSNIDVYKVLF